MAWGMVLHQAAKGTRSRPVEHIPAGEIAGFAGDPNFMTSLARGLAVIAAFTDRRRRPTIAELSRKTGIPRAAVRRCLYTLEKLGYVDSEAYSFSLLPKILRLGHAYLGSAPLAVSAQPFLDRVSEQVDESCSLAVLERDDILYLARSVTSRILSVNLNVGSRLPAYCTSIGQLLLADLPDAEFAVYLKRTTLVPYTNRTVASATQLREVLDAVRKNGHAIADQEMEVGIRSIAVPVRNAAGAVVAGINVIAQAQRMSIRDMKTKVLPYLQVAAAELSTILPR
jgi:IclR family pca regulon transcriptional regulator